MHQGYQAVSEITYKHGVESKSSVASCLMRMFTKVIGIFERSGDLGPTAASESTALLWRIPPG